MRRLERCSRLPKEQNEPKPGTALSRQDKISFIADNFLATRLNAAKISKKMFMCPKQACSERQITEIPMNKHFFFLFLAGSMLSCLLISCGPKDITVGDSEETIPTSVSNAEQMRYPMYGSGANQKLLYQRNLMNSMLLQQSAIQSTLRPSDIEAAERRKRPREASPFRE